MKKVAISEIAFEKNDMSSRFEPSTLSPNFKLIVTKYQRATVNPNGSLAVEAISAKEYFRGTGLHTTNAHPFEIMVSRGAVDVRSEKGDAALSLIHRTVACPGFPWARACLDLDELEFERVYPTLLALFNERVRWMFMTRWESACIGTGRCSHSYTFDCWCEKIEYLRGCSLWDDFKNYPCDLEPLYIDHLKRVLPNRHSLVSCCVRLLSQIPEPSSLPLPEDLAHQVALRLQSSAPAPSF